MPIRKVMEAQAIWRMFPRQIASEISRFHGRRIADWHRGTRNNCGELVLSSYELLELIEFPAEDGPLATALRGGERSEWQQMLAQAANELAVLRATQAPGADADEYGSRLFFTTAKQRELFAEQQALVDEEQQHNESGDGIYALWHPQEVS